MPDHKVEVVDAEGNATIYEAPHIIIATGARSRNLPNLPQDGKHIIGYREAMTLPQKPQSMVVVGSGAIGSEFAFFYQSIGVQVTLVEFMPTILPNEDEDTSANVARSFKKMGMKVMMSASRIVSESFSTDSAFAFSANSASDGSSLRRNALSVSV